MTQTQPTKDFEKILATALILATSDLAQFTEENSQKLRKKYIDLAIDFEISNSFKISEAKGILIAKNINNN